MRKKSNERKLFLLVWVVFSSLVFDFALAKVEAVIGNVDFQKNSNLGGVAPKTSESEIIISRSQYVISYNKLRRNPNWVAWKVDENSLGDVGRANRFLADRDLETYLTEKDGGGYHAVKPSEYIGSCYDRGHQTPSADRSDSKLDNLSTFTMTNMLPQTPYLNRVVWMHLEQYTRALVRKQSKIVYIITGPIYDEDYGSIGPNEDIQVPSKNFKVIVVMDQNQTLADVNSKTQMIAVIMPNVLADGARPDKDKDGLCKSSNDSQLGGGAGVDDWEQYKTTVADVQKQSGITLFPQN